MRATELIRNVLDLIDQVEDKETQQPGVEISVSSDDGIEGDRPFNQIKDLIDTKDRGDKYANTPCEKISSIEAVTTDAGGGTNGPKHPADIRTNAPSMYPGTQWRGN